MGQNLDFFPADVTTADGVRHPTCRVVVDGDRAVVFGSEMGRPVIVTQGVLPGGWEPSGLPYRMDVEGGEWTVRQSQGCGCSHPLKRLRGSQLLAMFSLTPAAQ